MGEDAAEKSASAVICRTCSQAACLCCLTTLLRRSGMANSALDLRPVDYDLPLLVTRNISDFVAFDGLQLLNWFSSP